MTSPPEMTPEGGLDAARILRFACEFGTVKWKDVRVRRGAWLSLRSTRSREKDTMLTQRQVRQLWGFGGARIVKEHAERTRRCFADDGVPVLIAARNEEEDLPATLLALSWSSIPVRPVVVVNGTTDATAERAERMGAVALESSLCFKMASLQHGVATIDPGGRLGPLLFTDADTLVGSSWAEIMVRRCRADSRPVVTLANSVFSHGESWLADAARSARNVAIDQLRRVRRQPSIAHGDNMAIDFAGSTAALEAYANIDPARFIGEEEEIVRRIVRAGGECRSETGKKAIVVTRGDRFNFADLLHIRRDPGHKRRAARYAEYGEVKPFVESDEDENPANFPANTTSMTP